MISAIRFCIIESYFGEKNNEILDSGNTTEIFVYLNGSVTTLATTISDTTQTAYVDSSVAVSPGDKISISVLNYTGSLTADLYVALNLVVA